MSITCLVIGDPHFKVNNVKETTAMHAKICEIARERRPTFIVCLGDVLDRHETIHVSPLERASTFLHELSTIAPLYVLVGNHDRPNNSNFLTTEHPFNALKYWPHTKIVDTTIEETINGKRFLFVPYVPPGRFNEAILTLIDKPQDSTETTSISTESRLSNYLSGITTIFAHQEFKGAKMGAIVSTVGDEWNPSWPYVISGHIHDYDELAKNIIYVGTPIQHGFGDRDDKTISYFTWTNEQYPETERIDLGLVKKMTVYISTSELATYVPPPDRQIKVVVTGTSAELKSAMKLANVKALLAAGVKVSYKDVPATTPLTHSTIPVNKIGPAMKYGARLHAACVNDPDLIEMFTRLFGKIQTTGHVPLKLKIIPASPHLQVISP